MRLSKSFAVGVLVVTAWISASARAAIVLDMSGAQGPFVDTSASGSANTTDTIEKSPTITNNANGFTVSGFNVTYTANAPGGAGGQYRFSIGFTDTVAQMVQVTISGSSYVTESPGATAATLNNFGSVSEGNNTLFTATSRGNIRNGADLADFQWKSSNMGMVAANTEYSLNVLTGVTFQAAAADNSILVLDPLTITITAVPEPSTWVTMALGCGGIGLLLRQQGSRCRHGAPPSSTVR